MQSIEWREKNRIDDILQWEPPEVLKLYYPVGIIGSDKDGCPGNALSQSIETLKF